jgi:hypothetical protein
MAEKALQCWSCLKLLRNNAGIALDGGDTKHICMTCWRKMPIYRRVQLQLLARSADKGGLGLRDMLERFMHAVDAAEDGQSPPLFPGRN